MNKNLIASAPAIRAYLGGSFNPVHNGHIQMAMLVYECLAPIAQEQQRPLHVALLPNARSPFKSETTHPKHRLNMLKLAIKGTPLQIDELELWQMPPVYTIDSVRALRQRYPHDSLIFIMGMDSARSLDKWKHGLQLTDYVNLWIFNRQHHSCTAALEPMMNKVTDQQKRAADAIDDIEALSYQLPISLQQHITQTPLSLLQPVAYTAHPMPKTSHPLKTNTQDRIYIDSRIVTTVSSSDIKQQLRTRTLSGITPYSAIQDVTHNTAHHVTHNVTHNVTELLNPTVYHYIIAHQLYSAAQFR